MRPEIPRLVMFLAACAPWFAAYAASRPPPDEAHVSAVKFKPISVRLSEHDEVRIERGKCQSTSCEVTLRWLQGGKVRTTAVPADFLIRDGKVDAPKEHRDGQSCREIWPSYTAPDEPFFDTSYLCVRAVKLARGLHGILLMTQEYDDGSADWQHNWRLFAANGSRLEEIWKADQEINADDVDERIVEVHDLDGDGLEELVVETSYQASRDSKLEKLGLQVLGWDSSKASLEVRATPVFGVYLAAPSAAATEQHPWRSFQEACSKSATSYLDLLKVVDASEYPVLKNQSRGWLYQTALKADAERCIQSIAGICHGDKAPKPQLVRLDQ